MSRDPLRDAFQRFVSFHEKGGVIGRTEALAAAKEALGLGPDTQVGGDLEQTLIDCLEYFENRQDADCVGDPLEYVPNEEMRLAGKVRVALDAITTRRVV